MDPRDIEKEYFLYNDTFQPAGKFDPMQATRYPSVYEVIRVIDGVPLFGEAHLDRLQKSVAMAGSSYRFSREDLLEQIQRLIHKNGVTHHNLKIILNGFKNGSVPDTYLLFITSRYPTPAELALGVPVITHSAERANPNAKIISVDFRGPILQALRLSGAYEALLVNQLGEVTEGSRSNYFLLKDDVFYTPPADQILEGITRRVVISLLERLGCPLVISPIPIDFLLQADGLFITGTSPGVLPVNLIDQHPLAVDLKPLQALKNLFQHFVATYISVHRE